MNTKHGHHTVPRSLNEHLSLDGKRVFLYRIGENKIIPTTPKDTFRRRHYHSIVKDDGSVDHNLLEDEFEKLESPGIAAIRRFIANRFLLPDDREWIATFIALQHLRTPSARAATEKILLEQLKAMALVMDAGQHFADMPEMPEALKAHGSSVTELIEKKMLGFEIALPQVTMIGIAAITSLAPIIARMNFCLIESVGTDYFILPDNPVTIFDPDYASHDFGLGFVYPNLEVLLPVAANYCILATPKPCQNIMLANRKRVHEINKRSAIFAEAEAIFPVCSRGIMQLLRKYREDTPGADAQTIPIRRERGVAAYAIVKRKAYSNEQGRRAYTSCKPLIRA